MKMMSGILKGNIYAAAIAAFSFVPFFGSSERKLKLPIYV